MFHNTRRILGTFKYVISRNRGLENRKNDLLTGHGVENITNIRITMFISLFIGLIALIAYATALSLNALLVFSMMFIFMSWYIGHLPNDKLSEDLDTHFGKHNFNPYKSYLGGRILITSRGVSLSLSKRTPLNIISRRQELTLKLAEARALAALPAPKDKSTSNQHIASQAHLKTMTQARADALSEQCCMPTTTATATATESNATPMSLGANPNNATQAYGNATAHTNVYGANDAAHLVDANVASALASSHAFASADAVAEAGASVGDESNCARGDAYTNENASAAASAGATPCTSGNASACANELSANFSAATNGAKRHAINAHASGVQGCGHYAMECAGSAIHACSTSNVAMSEPMSQTGRAAGAACNSLDMHHGLGGGAQASGFGSGDAADAMRGNKMASLRARKLVGAMFMDRPCSDAEDFVIGRALHMAQCADGNACSALNSGFMTTLETPLLSGVRLYPGIPMTDACCCQLISAIANKLNHTDKGGHAISVASAASFVLRGTDKALTFAANLLGGKEDGSDYAHVLNNHCATGRADLAKSNGQWVPPYHSSMRKMVRPQDVTFWGFGFIWGAEHTRLLHHKLEIGLRRAAYGSNGSPDIHAIGGQYHAYEPIYLPESNLKGHTLLLGTTGAGKTRFFDLEISQAIARGDTVIVIDPKGDRQLLRSIVRAAKDAGRDPIQDLFILDLSRKQFTPGADKHSFTCYDRCRGIVKPFGMEGSDDAADCSNLRGKDGLNRDNLADLNDYWATASDVDHELMTAPCDSLITDDMLNFEGYSIDATTGRVSVPNPAQHGSASGSGMGLGAGSGSGLGLGLGSEACSANGFCGAAMSFDGPRSEQDIAMMDALKRSEEFFANSSDKNHLQGGGEFRATFSNLYDSPASRFNERLMQDEHYQDVVAPAASAFAGTTGNWQGKELDVDDIIINCSNYGINPVGAFDQPAQIGARLTSMLSSSGSSASFKNYSNMAVTAAVVCCQLSGKHITVENIRDLVTDPNALQVALRRYINYKVEQIDNEVVQRLWNTIHGVGGPLNGIKGVVTAALGPHATGEAPVGNYHEIIDGLIKEGKISRAAFKSVLEQMKHSPTRPSKADLLTLFGNIAELDPIADASAITSLALSLFDSASERKEAEEACASTYVDVHEGDSVDATDILFANRESSTDPGASADISDERAAANAAANAEAAAQAEAEAEATAATPARKTRSRSKKTTTSTTKKTTTKRNTKKAPTLTASKKRVMCAQAENEVLQAFYDWLGKSGLCDDLVDCQIVFMVTALPVEYYRKVTNSVVPYLGSLTGGLLRGLLSGSRNGQALPSLRDLIEGNKIFVADIHCLKDATTGQNLGKMLLSDLAFVAGDINATGAQLKRISVFIDEASELADEALVQLLNKSRSAGFSITIATQSIADLSQRSGSKDAAHQIVANCNNLIAMRVNDPETAAIVSSVLPHTSVAQRSASVQYASDVFCGLTSIGHGLSMQDASLFPPDVLMMLPDFEYVARFSDGSCYKGFIPRLAPDEEVYPDIAKHKTATHAATSAAYRAATTFVPSSSTARAEAASSATAASSAACASAAPFASSNAAYASMTAMAASNGQTNSYAPFSHDTASNGMPKSNNHAALALNCMASMQQSSVNAAALASINTMAANGVTTAVPSCNASRGTAYAAANGGISMYAANELGNATQKGKLAMTQTNDAVVSAMGISSASNDNDMLDQVLWPDGVMMPGNYSPARESADGVSACFKEQFTDAQLMNNLKDPGKISLFYRRQHLEQMVKETTQESYAAYRNPEGFRLGNSSHSFHGIESPIHYFKERFSWQSFKAERDPKVRLALLLALPLLMLKYLCGSVLIMFIHTISFIKNKVLKGVLTELLMIAFIGLNLGLMFQDNFIEENADLIWDVYCYFQNLGESIYYCITNVTLCCPYLSYDNIADIISVGFIMIDWYIRNPSLMYSLILLGIMIGSHSKLMSAIHHTTPPASGLLTPSVNYLWSHKLSYVIVIIILTSFLVGFGVIFGREIAYLSTAGFLLISGYFVGAALTRTAK